MLTDAQIEKFRALYKKRFGKEISKEDALIQGVKLARLVSLIHKPMVQEEPQTIQEYPKAKGRKHHKKSHGEQI
jgi:hypothetical protein